MKRLILIFLFLLILIPILHAQKPEHQVRVIYFSSQGSDEVDSVRYDKLIKDIQDFFKEEMIRHGHTDKTFTLETDKENNLKIHQIKGKHQGSHYTGEVFDSYYDHISKEIPFNINNTTNRKAQDDVYIVIIGGVEIIDDGNGSPWGGGWTFHEASGGTAIINENFENLYPHHYTSIIAHELAHAFGLKHNREDDSLLGSLPFGGPSYITDYESNLLSTSPFFNSVRIQNKLPEFIGSPKLVSIGEDIVQFQIDVLGHVDLSYCQVSIYQDYVGSMKLENRVANVKIDIPRHWITKNPEKFFVLLYDVNGNKRSETYRNVSVPDPNITEEPIEEIPEENLSVSVNRKLTVLWGELKNYR